MKSQDEIVERIRKLLNMTVAKGCTEAEAATAMAHAQAYLEKYNLSMADMRTGEGAGEPTIIESRYDILGRFTWRKYLVHYLCQRNFCRAVFSWERDVVFIVGRPANVAAVTEITNWILPQLERLGRRATRKYKVGTDGRASKQRYRNSFFWGAITRVNNRLYEARQERISVDADTKALVVLREGEVDNYMADHYSTRKHSASGARSSQGYLDGLDAGNRVSLSGSSRQVKGGRLQLGSGER